MFSRAKDTMVPSGHLDFMQLWKLPKVYQEHYFMVTWKPLLKSVLLQRYLRSALCGAYFVYLCLLVSPAEPPFLKKVVIEESHVFLCYAWNYLLSYQQKFLHSVVVYSSILQLNQPS